MIDVQKKIGEVLHRAVWHTVVEFDTIASKDVQWRVHMLNEEIHAALNRRLLMDLRPSVRKPVVVHKRLGRMLRAHVGYLIDDGDLKVSWGLENTLRNILQTEVNRSYLNVIRAINDNISAP